MSADKGQAPDDRMLVRYLTGGMTAEEAEPIDELSVADADFEVRLRAVEYDLVDAYVNGELAGETLERFKSQYVSSPAGLAKVEMADALRGYRRDVSAPAARVQAPARSAARWPLAAAAVLALGAGLLLADNLRLRRQASEVSNRQAALEQQQRQLQEMVSRQQSEIAGTSQELSRTRDALAAAQAAAPTTPSSAGRNLLAFVLLPANRGVGDVRTLTIPKNAEAVTLRLRLEGDDYPSYEVALKAANADQAVWRSGPLRATSAGDRRTLSVAVRGSLLQSGAYTAEVIGLPARGESRSLDRYPFRVVLQ